MKKFKYLPVLPLLSMVVMTTSCAEPINTEKGLEEVYSVIDRIQATDYKENIKNISYYSNITYREHFSVPAEFTDAVSADFRVVKDESITRIDFTDPTDMYYYDFTARTYSYLTSYDSQTGKEGYSDSIVRFGYQFYKNKSGKYVLEMVGSRGVEAAKSLQLDKYPYITPSNELLAINEKLESGTNKFDQTEASVLFNELFTKNVEYKYRINDDFVNEFANDGTNSYEYLVDNKNNFTIAENKDLTFDYKAAVVETYDVTVVSIEPKETPEESNFLQYVVVFSNGKSTTININKNDNENIPTEEELKDPSSVSTLSEDGKWIVCGYLTPIANKESKIKGENKNVLINEKAGLNKEQQIVETFSTLSRFWAETETLQGQANREVNLSFNSNGFIVDADIEDERIGYYFEFSGEKYFTNYYVTADFNIKMPHVYGK